MTAQWKFSGNFRCILEKYLLSPCNIQNFLQFSVINYCEKLFFEENYLEIYFDNFAKFSMQLRKFSMHVIHYYMQSKMSCGYNLFISRTFSFCLDNWIPFFCLYFNEFFISGNFLLSSKYMTFQRFFNRILVSSLKIDEKESFSCPNKRTSSLLIRI